MVDGESWRKAATPVESNALKDFLITFFFAEGLCVVWTGQLPLLYPLRMYSYVYACLYVSFSLLGNICNGYCDKEDVCLRFR